MKDDTFTKIFLRVINILFLYNVIGTTFGVLFGLLLASMKDLFALYISQTGLIKEYGFVVFGVLLFNVPTFVKKKYLDPEIEKRLKYTREILKEGPFTEKERKMYWRKVMNTVIKEWSEDTENAEHNDSDNGVAD